MIISEVKMSPVDMEWRNCDSMLSLVCASWRMAETAMTETAMAWYDDLRVSRLHSDEAYDPAKYTIDQDEPNQQRLNKMKVG